MQITSRKYLAKVALHITSMRAVRSRILCAAYAVLRSNTQCAVLKISIHSLVLWQPLITRLGWACWDNVKIQP